LTVYSLDQRDSVGPINIALDSRPDAEIMQPFFLRSEFASGRIKTNVLDAWFNLSRVDHYYTGGMNYR
jgi:hypothetical protein